MKLEPQPDRNLGWLWAGLNLGLLPGLGTLLARRWLSGICQLAMSVLGGALFLITAFRVIVFYYSLAGDAQPESFDTAGKAPVMLLGLGLFGAAWFWALFSSARILQDARRQRQQQLAASTPPCCDCG